MNSWGSVPGASLRVSKCFALKSFHTVVATVAYCHFVNYVIASRQMVDIQTEGIVYRKLACLEPVRSEWIMYHVEK